MTGYRSRLDDVCSAGQDTSTETGATASADSYGQQSSHTVNSSNFSGGVSVGCTSQTFYSSPQYRDNYSYFPSSSWPGYGSEFFYPSNCYGGGIGYDPYGWRFPSQVLPSSSSESSATSPFIVKLLKNRIKKCRGCNRDFTRKVDGSPPDPPMNLVIRMS